MNDGRPQTRLGKRQTERVVPFRAGDGFQCNLLHVRGEKPPTKCPVLLVHGAGVRANIFRAPVQTTIVDYLIEHGYDVWLENWRASIDLTPNAWTLDQAAVYDHPQAVKTVVKETGCSEVKAIIHCQGSTSFAMSAVAGLLPEVRTIVSNAVSLHPVVPAFSRLKLNVALPFISLITPHLNPQWGVHAPTLAAKVISLMVALVHHECDNAVCKQVSFTYGSGFPALWSHDNLNAATHEWLKREFAEVPISFFQQIARCVRRGHLLSVEGKRELPIDFATQPPQTDARFALLSGEDNLCFLPESQRRTHEFLDRYRRNYHTLHVLPKYGHLDIFMGQGAARDVFPLILAELEKSPMPQSRPLQTEIIRMKDTTPGVTFGETMAGGFSLGETDPNIGDKKGKAAGHILAMHATITIQNLERFISDPAHTGHITGSIDFPPFGENIPAKAGVFNLFSPSTQPKLKLMVYEMAFEHQGQDYYLVGKKEIQDDPGVDLWKDTTTLFTVLHKGRDKSTPVAGAGILTLGPIELMKMLSTMRALNTSSTVEGTKAVMAFGKFFLGELWNAYMKK